VAALTLAASGQRAVEVMAELQKGPVELAADEWVFAPELVVDGTVLGRRSLAATASGALIHLAAGEDQRVFLAEARRWNEDPNRPVNRKREGGDYRLRNLSAEAVSFACYLTQPISAAKGVTVTTDPATTAGWKSAQPGILHWELTLHHGWIAEAEGKIRL
jgi:hypothetical protein